MRQGIKVFNDAVGLRLDHLAVFQAGDALDPIDAIREKRPQQISDNELRLTSCDITPLIQEKVSRLKGGMGPEEDDVRMGVVGDKSGGPNIDALGQKNSMENVYIVVGGPYKSSVFLPGVIPGKIF